MHTDELTPEKINYPENSVLKLEDFRIVEGLPSPDESSQLEHPSGNILRLTFTPKILGSLNSENISFKLGNQAISFTMPAVAVVMDKEGFQDKRSLAVEYLNIIKEKAKFWLNSIARAYTKAWKKHTETLKKQMKRILSIVEFFINIVTSIVGYGIKELVSWIFKLAGKKPVVDAAKEGTTQGAKQGAKKGVEGVQGQATKKPFERFKDFPQEPSEWKEVINDRITNEIILYREYLLNLGVKVSNSDSGLDFDPYEKVKELTIDGKKESELKPVDESNASNKFEKTFWKIWILRHRMTKPTSKRPSRVKKNLGRHIKKRLKELGMDISEIEADSPEQA